MPAVPLSVVIITFNEEANIGRCLAALGDVADDVVVVDSGSADRTVAICQEHSARVVHHPFEGYVQQKNFATAQARHDYVLQLDADEVLTDELRAEIRQIKADWRAAGYTLPRLTNYCGHWVRHGGWYPDRKLRLYDRRLGSWQGHLLHERYELTPGQLVQPMRHDLLHYSYHSIEQHVAQFNRFSSIGAEELAARGKRAATWQLWLKPVWKFVHMYFLRLGMLDGFAGLSIAYLSACSVFVKYAKLRVINQQDAARS
ncbi:glycosyltransferase family 2 protein [Hymenobacter oligotrophus]|uniref:Glycosyltransferase family 2 protein n=1 Tax=Hymenobacter oligotrophus TaxID=2319843 RepID=A0A3B7R329_9BACT|nr:glycosyltransferase family 2 protein [Hymenobacter oligotrophus]AYA38415.1 glycosyltransferase family 2 protein [Hymenobacter oligotrophus]